MNSLKATNIVKKILGKKVFKPISFEIEKNGIYVINGVNGSGKSTLLKILLGFIEPSSGNVFFGEKLIKKNFQKYHAACGFVAPYYQLFYDLTAYQNVSFVLDAKNISFSKRNIDARFKKFQLEKKEHLLLQNFSSGMLQRFKLLLATVHNPQFVFLDEPSSNLDEKGKKMLQELVKELSVNTKVIIATNDEYESKWGRLIAYLD